MEILDVLNKELIFVKKKFSNTHELFDFIGDKSNELGLSKKTYSDALEEREFDFPTGLQLENIGVAIPHADSEHINEEFISLITLDKPVKFNSMEDSAKEIEVKIVFVLGLQNANDQLETLQSIVRLLQDNNILIGLKNATNIDDVLSVLNNPINT